MHERTRLLHVQARWFCSYFWKKRLPTPRLPQFVERGSEQHVEREPAHRAASWPCSRGGQGKEDKEIKGQYSEFLTSMAGRTKVTRLTRVVAGGLSSSGDTTK